MAASHLLRQMRWRRYAASQQSELSVRRRCFDLTVASDTISDEPISDARAEELLRYWRQKGPRPLIDGAEARLRHLLEDLVSDGVIGAVGEVEGSGARGLLLAGQRGTLAMRLSDGVCDEVPVITVTLLPHEPTPLSVVLTDQWGGGQILSCERGKRVWAFSWEGQTPSTASVSYWLPKDLDGDSSPPQQFAADLAAQAVAHRLASVAGWPLPASPRG